MEEIITCLESSYSVAILTHVNMDGDSFGSSLALYHALKSLGKDVTLITEEEPQELFKFLPESSSFCLYFEDGEDEGLTNSLLSKKIFDLVIAVDSADFERLGTRGNIFLRAKKTLNIDHHPTNTNYAQHNYVVADASATGEIVYSILSYMNFSFDSNIATCIYTAISSDTGGFRFANTTSLTHKIASELIDLGADSYAVSMNLFENTSMERLRMLGEVINRLELHFDGRLAIILLPQDVIAQYNASEEDVGGFSNIGRSIRGVRVAIFIRERSNGLVKVSMRAKDGVDLTLVATRHGGGGHKRAAGFDTDFSLYECREMLLKEFSDIL